MGLQYRHGPVQLHQPLELRLIVKLAFTCPELLGHLDAEPDRLLNIHHMAGSGGTTRNSGLSCNRDADNRRLSHRTRLEDTVEMIDSVAIRRNILARAARIDVLG